MSTSALLAHDLVRTLGTSRVLDGSLDRLRERNVRSVRIACTHGLFAAGALDRLTDQPEVQEIVCTNTVPIPKPTDKLRVLSVAPALAEAIRRIHIGESVSVLFG